MKYFLFLICCFSVAETTSLANLRLQSAYLTPGEVDKITVDITLDYGEFRRSESIFIAVSETEDFAFFSWERFYVWKDGEEGVEKRFQLHNRQPSGDRFIRVAIGWGVDNLVDITPATPSGDPWSLSTRVTINDGVSPVKLVFYDSVIDTAFPIIRWQGGGPSVLFVDVDVKNYPGNEWREGSFDFYRFPFNDSGLHTIDLSDEKYAHDSQIFFRIRGSLSDNTTTDFTGTSVIYRPISQFTWPLSWTVSEDGRGTTNLIVMNPTDQAAEIVISYKEKLLGPYQADVDRRYRMVYPGQIFSENVQNIYPNDDLQGYILTISSRIKLFTGIQYNTDRHGPVPLQTIWMIPEGNVQDWLLPVEGDIDHRIAFVIGNHDVRNPGQVTDVGWTFNYTDNSNDREYSFSGSERVEPHDNVAILLDDAAFLRGVVLPESYSGFISLHNTTTVQMSCVLSIKNLIDGKEFFTFVAGVQVK